MADNVTLADMEDSLRVAVGDLLPSSVTWTAWDAVVVRIYWETIKEIQHSLDCSWDEAAYLLRTMSLLHAGEGL